MEEEKKRRGEKKIWPERDISAMRLRAEIGSSLNDFIRYKILDFSKVFFIFLLT